MSCTDLKLRVAQANEREEYVMEMVTRLQDLADKEFDPFLEDELVWGTNPDPYPAMDALRKQGSVVQGNFREAMGGRAERSYPPEAPQFMVLGYKAASEVLRSPEVFSNSAYQNSIGQVFGRSVTTMDPPEHGRFRRIFQKIFLPQFVNAWGGSIVDPVVHELIDDFVHTGRVDLITQFTLHYPFRVIYRQLELPMEEATIFHKLAVTQGLISQDREHSIESSEKLGVFFQDLIDEKRRHPGEDLVSLLATVEDNGERLPDEVVVSFFRQLINAAGDTTYRGTSVLFTKLLENPDQLEAVRNDRSLVPNAIEEALRFDGPVSAPVRWTVTDVKIDGTTIPAGSVVHVLTGSANRDPAVFPNPNEFDIRRPNAKRHLSFGGGPHLCLGQHLAKVEMTRAITAVLDRLPNLRADPDMPPAQIQGIMMRVPKHLYARFDPPAAA